jgi:hypothetical protein
LDTLIRVFRADFSGVPSLEIVRLLHRMIKEKRFNVHPSVLSCLLHLRLKTELSVRSSESKTDRPEHQKKAYSTGRAAARRAKGKATDQVHLGKKARKALKEKKEIEKEFNEAEAEVDKEERAATVRAFTALAPNLPTHRFIDISANRNTQTAIRALLPNPQKPTPHTSAPGRTTRHLEIRPPCQH